MLTSTYLSHRVADSWIRAHGYRVGPYRLLADMHSVAFECRSPAHALTLVLIHHTPADTTLFAEWVRPGKDILFVNDQGAVEFQRLTEGTGRWTSRSADENGLLSLYTHLPQ